MFPPILFQEELQEFEQSSLISLSQALVGGSNVGTLQMDQPLRLLVTRFFDTVAHSSECRSAMASINGCADFCLLRADEPGSFILIVDFEVAMHRVCVIPFVGRRNSSEPGPGSESESDCIHARSATQTYTELLQEHCAGPRFSNVLSSEPIASQTGDSYHIGLRRHLECCPDFVVVFQFYPDGKFRVRSDLDIVIRVIDYEENPAEIRDVIDAVRVSSLLRFVIASMPDHVNTALCDFLQRPDLSPAQFLAVSISCFFVGCYRCFATGRLMYGRSFRQYANQSLEDLRNHLEDNDTVIKFASMIKEVSDFMNARQSSRQGPWKARLKVIGDLRAILAEMGVERESVVQEMLSGEWFHGCDPMGDSKLIQGFAGCHVASPLATGKELLSLADGHEKVRLVLIQMLHVRFEEEGDDARPVCADSYVDSKTTAVIMRDLRTSDYPIPKFRGQFRKVEMSTTTSFPEAEFDRSRVPVQLSLQIEVDVATGFPTVQESAIDLRHLCQMERHEFQTKMAEFLTLQQVHI